MRTRPHWAGELVVVAFLLVVYDQIAGLASNRAGAAYSHGRAMLALSPDGFEKAADLWLAGVSWLQDPAALYYDLAHINVTFLVLVACYVWRGSVYRRARTALVVVNLIGLAVFWLYPVAPPRLLPGEGFVDIVSDSGTFGSSPAGLEHSNAYGSMPSLHTSWAVWVALAVMTMTGVLWVRVLAWAHVAVTLTVVIITGNHYLVDLVAGAATIALAWAVAPSLRLALDSQVLHSVPAGAVEPG